MRNRIQKLVYVTFTVVALGFMVGCDNSKSSGNRGVVNPYANVCNQSQLAPEQYQACINSIQGVGTNQGLYRGKIRIDDKDQYEEYLERLNICGNLVAILSNDCRYWNDNLGVELQVFATAPTLRARVFMDSIAFGWPFNNQEVDGTYVGKQPLMNTVADFVNANQDNHWAVDRNGLRLVITNKDLSPGTEVPVAILYDGVVIADGYLQPVVQQRPQSCYTTYCF